MQIWSSPPALRLVAFSPHYRPRRMNWHHHLFYELGMVMAGSCEWYFGKRRRIMLRAGEAILLKPGTQHGEVVDGVRNARLAWLGFDLEGPTPAWCQKVISLGSDRPEITSYFEAIAGEHHLSDQRSQIRIGLALQSLVLLLERRAETRVEELKMVGPVAPKSDLNARQIHTVESAAHYFQNNLQDPLSIAQVAGYHSLCPAHFSSLFRRHHRLTPRAYLRMARLKQAADLLGESDLAIKEIASRCGFVDSAHLCKSFKLEYGIPPNSFRKSDRQRIRQGMHAVH